MSELTQQVRQWGIVGAGGAGFPTYVKLGATVTTVIVNAAECEPLLHKDKELMRARPAEMIEGLALAMKETGAAEGVIGVKAKYEDVIALLEARRAANMRIHPLRDYYPTGDEFVLTYETTGRVIPPGGLPKDVGCLVQNVETLYWVRDIVEKGAAWFTGHGRRGRKGLRSFSVSGRVKKPGVVLAPAGVSARELIDEFCGGMQDGHRFKGYLPGGASGGILPAAMADLPLDFGTLEPQGCFVGSGAVIVLSDRDDLAEAARNLLRFFRNESCGQCTPCRVGTAKAAALLEAPVWDRALLTELAAAMADGSICGLGQAAMNPVLSLLRHIPEAVP